MADEVPVPEIDTAEAYEAALEADLSRDEPSIQQADPAPEPVPEPAPDSPSSPEPPQVSHPRGLVNLALSLGIDQGRIDRADTETLSDMVELVHQQRQQWSQERPSSGPGVPPQPVLAPVEEVFDWGVDEDGQPIKEEDLNPSLVRHIKAQDKRLKELDSKFENLQKTEQQREQERLVNEVDRAFEGVNRPELFGKGGIAEVAPGSVEEARRQAVYVQALRNKDDRRPLGQKLQAAAEMLFGKSSPPVTAPIPKETWNKGALQKPTQRGQPNLPPGEEKARQAVSDFLATNGATPAEPTTLDEFPD